MTGKDLLPDDGGTPVRGGVEGSDGLLTGCKGSATGGLPCADSSRTDRGQQARPRRDQDPLAGVRPGFSARGSGFKLTDIERRKIGADHQGTGGQLLHLVARAVFLQRAEQTLIHLTVRGVIAGVFFTADKG